MKFNFTICSLLFYMLSFCQNTNTQIKIKTNLEDYFHFERENIHVQFNKTIFISNENIAFKGYVFNKESSLPNLNTTNIQLVIYNAQGQIVQRQLLHCSLGIFDGIVSMDEKTASGKYRFHFYTNWMNNFMEDESFVQNIEIINKNEPYNLTTNQADFSTASITFNPESGAFIKEINNTIGIQIKDCNDIGIQIMEGFVVDSKGTTITTFFTNKMGYGKFDLTPESNETYSVKIATDKIKMQKQLPKPTNSGIAITYNNNLPNNDLEVSVKTNSDGVNLYQNKNYTLLIHQNGKHIQKEFNFNDKNPIQILTFDKNDLLNGVNSIRIIDENLNEIAERLLYLNKQPKEIPAMETQFTANDSISLLGKLNSKVANLSISILPTETVCLEQKNSILGTFYLNAYLEKPIHNNYFYFDRQNVTRAFDMELLMLNQAKSKYLWNNIMSHKPIESYKFTKGITINGTIVKPLNPKKKYKVALISLRNKIFEETIVDKNNKFSFDSFFARDSTAYQLELMDENNLAIETKMITNILYNKEPFLKKQVFEVANCLPIKNMKINYKFDDPKFDKKTKLLKEVTIKNTYRQDPNNSNNLLYSKNKGNNLQTWKMLYHLTNSPYAYNYSDTSYCPSTNSNYQTGINSRQIYIDGFDISDRTDLYSISTEDVDYISISSTRYSNLALDGYSFNIKLKNISAYPIKHNIIILNSGFEKPKIFQSNDFAFSKEFEAFGTIQWSPNLYLDTNQIFELKFPKINQKEVLVMIEGFTVEGQLISEIKKISTLAKQ